MVLNTVNVDIFGCIHFRELEKTSNFAGIQIRVFDNIASKWHDKSYFHVEHIFADILKISRKYVQRVSTFTVSLTET